MSEPALPRVRRPPRWLDSCSDPHQFSSPKEYYKRAYFEFADTLNGELNIKRFCQKNYELYMKAEQLLLTAATTGDVMTENMKEVCGHFGEDLDERLKNQLSVLSDVVEGASPSLKVIQQAILSLNTTSSLFSEVLNSSLFFQQALHLLKDPSPPCADLKHI